MKKLINFIRKYERISICIVFCVPFIIGIILTKVVKSDVPMLFADIIAVSAVIGIEYIICGDSDNIENKRK